MNLEPRRWTVPAWQRMPGLTHGFFGRAGGFSGGAYASLNCSERVGDDPETARRNRARVAATLSCERVVVPRQVHGDAVVVAGRADAAIGEADGIVVRHAGIAVGVLTADCVPLLFAVPGTRLAAAAHAGWKGTALGIAARAVEGLIAQGAEAADAIHVALGPSIDGCCYEVGDEVAAALAAGQPGAVEVRRRAGEKVWIDLREINAAVLRRAGVPAANIHRVGPCTRCAAAELFSHRASGGNTGRQLSAIGWL